MVSWFRILIGALGSTLRTHRELALENLALLQVVRPETVVRWHRWGFRRYWAWKSRRRSSRPVTRTEPRELIRRMSLANPLWGAPRMHGELLKLGLTVSQATVSKYMLRHRRPPSQAWHTFLENHAKDLIAVDFFTVPTATFRVLWMLIVLSHGRRRLAHFNVTAQTRKILLRFPPWLRRVKLTDELWYKVFTQETPEGGRVRPRLVTIFLGARRTRASPGTAML